MQVSVDVISDVVCPWCFIGQKRLDTAIAAVPDVDVDVRWRPFQLDPTIPPEGKDRKAYMLAKFGSEARLKEIHDRIVPLGAADGIAFDFHAIEVSPNTLDAHRLIRWAGARGADVQGKVTKRLFQLYFEEGVNIGDHAVLAEVAGANAMDAGIVRDLLATDADKDAVRAEIENAQAMGVSGVPFFVLDGKYAVSGAQDAATLADAIRQVAGIKAKEMQPAK